jgi:hypothetical protein
MGDLGEEIETTKIPEPDWTEKPTTPAVPQPDRADPAPAPEKAPEREPEKTPA